MTTAPSTAVSRVGPLLRRAHRPRSIEVALPGRTLLLVAGIPGAGKSTLLAGLPSRDDVVVLDSQLQREAVRRVIGDRILPYAWYRPLVHLMHRIALVAAALSTVPTVVVHLPATTAGTRAVMAMLAALTGRTAHLLWLHADPEDARRGQRERGRLVRGSSFEAHARNAEASVAELRAGPPAGWASVLVVDRAAASGGLRLDTRRQ